MRLELIWCWNSKYYVPLESRSLEHHTYMQSTTHIQATVLGRAQNSSRCKEQATDCQLCELRPW
jgi:hypothetical protein